MWGRKAVSCVVKTYPKPVLKTSRARVVVKQSTTASAYRWTKVLPTSYVSLTHCFFSHCRDAAWELEPGAFSELYQRYRHCDAPMCLYEQGRDSFEDEG
ncbi:PHD finger protein 7 [Camelus dromedarius]|uniref:PHD finger protein 7 n=1 Tax=Camelus dromedarius TaxID=9838 RepID=A0A5N4CZI6_CAMDR|nr:PHD finger protein 7 [Camelus dromedarius]